ncbi:MAG: ribokinase [Thermomicrobiales bacterium]
MAFDARWGRVLVAGSINTDLVVRVPRAPKEGETVTGDRFDIFGGGKGANQAVAAARSGAPTAMLGSLGNDDFGRQRLADLEADQIDCTHVAIIDDHPSGVALITVEESGENRIAYIPGATRAVTTEQAITALQRVDPAVVLATLELPSDALDVLFLEARTSGVPVIVNATPEPATGRALALQADVLVVNESEARELLGVDSGQRDWQDVAKRLREHGPSSVIVTLGAAGAVLVDGAGIVRVQAPTVDVVDTTGAGDAFCGALAGQVASGADLAQAMKVGVAAGAVAVTKPGAQPSMPERAAIEAMLKIMARK